MSLAILSTVLLLSPSPFPQTVSVGPVCVETIEDQAGPGCLEASSTPVLGSLYPLSEELFVGPTGDVGIGTTSPTSPLHLVVTNHPSAISAQIDNDDVQGGLGLYVDMQGINTAPYVPIGIVSETEWVDGIGIAGTSGNTALLGPIGAGVIGLSDGETEMGFPTSGVFGWAQGNSQGYGVHGIASSRVGHGVLGYHDDPNGRGAGVAGWSESSDTWARGVEGDLIGGVYGQLSSCVYGRHPSNNQNGIGVAGLHDTSGYGLFGEAYGAGIGVRGASASGGLAVLAFGDFVATGIKSFAQPHPTDPSKEIRFVCLEGNESGTYFRGSAELVEGRARIEVPEDFRLASEPTSITVQVTPLGPELLWIERKGLDEIVVRGGSDVEFDYFVNGVRRGFANHETIQDNRCFKPDFMDVPFAGQHPEGLRRILVENGILNPDYTPNLATARALGWDLLDADEHPSRTKRAKAQRPAMTALPAR